MHMCLRASYYSKFDKICVQEYQMGSIISTPVGVDILLVLIYIHLLHNFRPDIRQTAMKIN